MADVVTVEARALTGLCEGLKVLHKALAEAGGVLTKSFRSAEVFERTNPIEAVSSTLESCVLTARSLGKTASEASDVMAKAIEAAKAEAKAQVDALKAELEKANKEKDEALEFAGQQVKAMEHIAKGEVHCPSCGGMGKAKATKEGEGAGQMECPMCGGTGFVTRKQAADALRPGGAYKNGKLPGRGSAIRTAV